MGNSPPEANFIEMLSRKFVVFLPAKIAHEMNVLWLVVCLKLLSENICLAKFSVSQLSENGRSSEQSL